MTVNIFYLSVLFYSLQIKLCSKDVLWDAVFTCVPRVDNVFDISRPWRMTGMLWRSKTFFSCFFCILNGELDVRKHAMKAVDGFLEGNMKVRSCMHMDHGLQKMMTYLIFFRHNIGFLCFLDVWEKINISDHKPYF